jgi:hypothetical protein
MAANSALFFFSSCTFFKNENKAKPIARVYDNYLYRDDIQSMIPEGTSETDSLQLVQNYIQAWIKKQLLIRKADLNLTSEQKDVEKQLENYRVSLIIFEYEKEYIRQYLDTVVSSEEIEQYYDNHMQDFILKNNIYDLAYIKLKKTTTNLEKAKKWFVSGKEENLLALEDFAFSNANDFSLKKENWMPFDVLIRIIPFDPATENILTRNNTIFELADSTANYLAKINAHKLKNSVSPLTFEIENIRNIVINKRKLKLIEGLENSIYKNAQTNGEFEVY